MIEQVGSSIFAWFITSLALLSNTVPSTGIEDGIEVKSGSHSFRLSELAYLRSGDKGNTANVGVVARHPSFVPYLRKYLTAEAVENYFEHLLDLPHCYRGAPRVARYVQCSRHKQQ